MQNITVFGNGGTLTARADTGDVLHYEPDALDEQNTGYGDIHRFDVDEWRRTYPGEDITNSSIDICDIGYWYKVDDSNTLYEEPSLEWRKLNVGDGPRWIDQN